MPCQFAKIVRAFINLMRYSNELGEVQAELDSTLKENAKLKQLARDLRDALNSYADPEDMHSQEIIELLYRALQLI